MNVAIAESWKAILQPEFEKPYFEALTTFVKAEYGSKTVYPPGKLIFNAFDKCSFQDLKVVIIGQDPYHGPGQANGLSFSVNVAFSSKTPCEAHLSKLPDVGMAWSKSVWISLKIF